MVWAGVSPQDLAAVSSSGQQVIDALEGVGESDERGFHPHITVARVRSPRNLEALDVVIRELLGEGVREEHDNGAQAEVEQPDSERSDL